MAVLDQACADSTRAEALGKQHMLQLHGPSTSRRARQLLPCMRKPGRSPARIRPAPEMRTRTKYFWFCAWLVLGVPADAEQWFAVASPAASPAGAGVEVDLDSIRPRGHGGEGVIRVTFDVPQQHGAGFPYRSVVASAQFDCQRR